jgi:hypothetical protein
MTLAQHIPPQPAAPTISLNGTEAQFLFDANRAVVDHLYDAKQAMRNITPHGRDYIGHPEEFERARHEHKQRLLDLERIILELDLIALTIQRQQRS